MAAYGGLALSLAAVMENRKVKGLIVAVGFALVLLIGFSRLYLGVHFMSDVLAGFCAGLGCVLLLRWVDEKWTALSQPRRAATTGAFQPSPSPRALEQMQLRRRTISTVSQARRRVHRRAKAIPRCAVFGRQ